MANRAWLYGYGTSGAPPSDRQLARALRTIGYDFGYAEQRVEALHYLESFVQRWGALSVNTLAEVLRHFAPVPMSDLDVVDRMVSLEPTTPEEEDTLFALAAFGVMRTPEAASFLLPYLESPRAQERWLAVLGLTAMRDERTLPALERVLVEFVGPNQPWTPERGNIAVFQVWRHKLLRLLADWGNKHVVPPMRAALIAAVRAEEIEVPAPREPEQEFIRWGQRFIGREAWREFYDEQKFWTEEEHQFVYALGRLGAFGALAGVHMRVGIYNWMAMWDDGDELPGLQNKNAQEHADIFRLNIWRVHACCGFLEPQFLGQSGRTNSFADVADLAAAVDQLLAGEFGLGEAERHQAMEDYDQAGYVYATVNTYRRIAEQAQEDAEQADEDGH